MPERLRSLPVVHACGVTVRPCPREDCRHHLAQGEKPRKFAARADCSETCSLDVADLGGLGQREVAAMIGVIPQRAQQIEVRALRKLASNGALANWRRHSAPSLVFPWLALANALYVMFPREKSGPTAKQQEGTNG